MGKHHPKTGQHPQEVNPSDLLARGIARHQSFFHAHLLKVSVRGYTSLFVAGSGKTTVGLKVLASSKSIRA